MKLSFWLLSCIIPICLVIFYPKYAKKHSTLFILNSLNRDSLPPRFRETSLLTSGSAQFSESELVAIRKKIPPMYPLYIIDLRQEAHGFLNGMGVSWYGQHNWYHVGLKKEEVLLKEKEQLKNLSKKSWVFVYYKRQYPIPHWVHSVDTEEEITKKMGIGYFRLPVTDHRRPSDQDVDTFLEIIQLLSREEHPTWIHFHCSAGRGRTTTFLLLYDIFLHAKKESFEEIISRHLMGAHLFKIEGKKKWKQPYIKERVDFIKNFYHYCYETSDLSWSQWISQKNN